MLILQEVVRLLKICINEIKTSRKSMGQHPPVHTGALRKLQKEIRKEVFRSKNHNAQFIAFFLNSFILSAFSNLFGDTPDDGAQILRSERKKFLERSENLLRILHKNVQANDQAAMFDTLGKMVAVYATTINKINLRDIEGGNT